jgi:hypothetical protein
MTPSEAKELSHLLERVGALLDQSAGYVRDHDSEANFIEYRTVIGKLMGDMFLDAMSPLHKRFPELLPDYLGGPYMIPESVYLPSFYHTTAEDSAIPGPTQKNDQQNKSCEATGDNVPG